MKFVDVVVVDVGVVAQSWKLFWKAYLIFIILQSLAGISNKP